ncbi:MAG: DEAD/DEAH box helicase [Eubacteriaceae bacterium]|nr:DEAD/DEAH box helicase [Eubacteriaceae bacterium]
MGIAESLSESLKNGFVDCSLSSLEKYDPKLLVNDHKKGKKVLTTIENELRSCEEFYFSVAFITGSGVTSLINILSELEQKNIKGKIITSQYQNFTQPAALTRLLKFRNIELKIVTEGNFHAKGYIFRHTDSYSFIIGSSNLTQDALGSNKEWNVKLSSLENGAVMQNIIREFDRTFEDATAVNEAWIEEYSKIYQEIRASQKAAVEHAENNLIRFEKINPNKMQVEALKAIESLRNDGRSKALLISATGTGKTYLSAFDVRKYNPERFLFVVHRGNIARAAERSFKRVLGAEIDTGFITGGRKDKDSRYTFATVQTLAKDSVLGSFDKEHFDYIVIDEVHRSGAETYQKVLKHFEPKFLLGMTATPERTDGYDIFESFDHNIAYEIRLNRALEENMLVPFHYFGVSEIAVDGKVLDDNAEFRDLICDERVDRIIEAADFYGHDGDRVKGLVFCSRTEEAARLSLEFNSRGFRTAALTGSDTEDAREEAIEKLETDNGERGSLDYIFTVDIFNEGVDIPSLNQIIMLRPTQSAIVFVQQLGRGLRKHGMKEYLTVIDFIGNYSNNYLLPIALYGDKTYNKDTIRKLMNSGSSTIPGSSTVQFDSITKEKIFKAIDKARLDGKREMKNDYRLMKYQLGRVPTMMDFMKHGGREPYSFVSKCDSYYGFLRYADRESTAELPESRENLLAFYSKEILNGKRVEEAVILALLLTKDIVSAEEVRSVIENEFGFESSEGTLVSATDLLNGGFIKAGDRAKYGIEKNIDFNGMTFTMEEAFKGILLEDGMHGYLDDMIKYSFARYKKDFDIEKYRDGFNLYAKYSRKDACRILNWKSNEEGTIFGYRVKYDTCPIFVTYNKKENITSSTKYEDEFINPYCFSWMTRNNVTLKTAEIQPLLHYGESGVRIPLFIKKSDGEGTDFYYMGDVEPAFHEEDEIKNDKNKMLPIVNFKFTMKDEVEESMYRYLEE